MTMLILFYFIEKISHNLHDFCLIYSLWIIKIMLSNISAYSWFEFFNKHGEKGNESNILVVESSTFKRLHIFTLLVYLSKCLVL